MPLGISASQRMFSRALDYDMFLKDLSNPRVFTDTDCVSGHRLERELDPLCRFQQSLEL
jgi:hypothetical protein